MKHLPHPHLQRRHVIKLCITAGCVVSSVIVVLMPGMALHATILATATNVVWVWT